MVLNVRHASGREGPCKYLEMVTVVDKCLIFCMRALFSLLVVVARCILASTVVQLCFLSFNEVVLIKKHK